MPIIYKRAQSKVLPLAFEARRLVSLSSLEIIELTFHPGQVLPTHDNPQSVIFCIKSGEGLLTIGNEAHPLTEGDCAFVEQGHFRGWANTGTQDLVIFVIKLTA